MMLRLSIGCECFILFVRVRSAAGMTSPNALTISISHCSGVYIVRNYTCSSHKEYQIFISAWVELKE